MPAVFAERAVSCVECRQNILRCLRVVGADAADAAAGDAAESD